MEVEWNEAKSARCLRERGFSFAYVVQAFADPDRLIERDTRFPLKSASNSWGGSRTGFLWSSLRGAVSGPASSPRERRTAVSNTTTVRARIDGDRVYLLAPDGSQTPLVPEIDRARLVATGEAEIARQSAADDAEARADAAAHIRGLRRARTGLSQAAFARQLNVSVETLRNWEQGKRLPQGPARALLRVMDKAPATAMAALVG